MGLFLPDFHKGDQGEGQDDVAHVDRLLKDVPGEPLVYRCHQATPKSVIGAWKEKGHQVSAPVCHLREGRREDDVWPLRAQSMGDDRQRED